ncbi:MAG: diguanylate cyclase [Lachnospiraceae bacterium]|nr:diguanylate cyclase [Lachnospiraceae bacterium]
MDSYESIYKKWRKTLLTIDICAVICICMIEIGMYFYLHWLNLIDMNVNDYLWNYLFIPTIVNVLLVAVAYIVESNMKSESIIINYVPIVLTLFIITVIACVHFHFSVMWCCFPLPILLTIVYMDKKMTKRITIMSFLCLVAAIAMNYYHLGETEFYLLVESIISVVCLVTVYIATTLIIKVQKEKNLVLSRGFSNDTDDVKDGMSRTGFYNYTAFMEILSEKLLKAQRKEDLLALAIVDLDGIDEINEIYGYFQGDMVIAALVGKIKELTTEGMTVAELNKQQFAIIFDNDIAVEAYNIVEKLRMNFFKESYGFMDEMATITVGLTMYKKGWDTKKFLDVSLETLKNGKNSQKNTTNIYLEK